MPNILVNNNFYQGTSSACIVDLTPPTFAGINFLDVESRGQIRAGWSAASDPNTPIRYEVYIQASTSVGLFNTLNIVAITDKLQYDIFTLPSGAFLQNGTTYYVGVRAIDAISNRDANLVSMSVISTGVLTSIDVYSCQANYAINESNQFLLTMWANKNHSLAKSPNAVMGTASYQVYDKNGAAVGGMSGSGITINSEGAYIAPPVSNSLNKNFNNYYIKVTISVDGENRVNFINICDEIEQYAINGVASLNTDNELIGSFWIEDNGKVVTSNLGSGSYKVYTADGVLVPGLLETGMAANIDGLYVATPIPVPPSFDTTQSYIIQVTAIVNGITRTHNITVTSSPTVYTPKATFSINALNQLEATFWATKNDDLVDPTILGTASYQIYDKNGVAVIGLTESGIAADVQGLFHTTPVSAVLLSDLTHYVAKVTINVANADHTAVKGFTLLGT